MYDPTLQEVLDIKAKISKELQGLTSEEEKNTFTTVSRKMRNC